MARIRSIKPEFWTSEQVVECSTNARLLFVGMWNFCDDCGRHPYSPRRLKMCIFPGDDGITTQHVSDLMGELVKVRLIAPYVVDGEHYFAVSGWSHQKIDRPQPTKWPGPEEGEFVSMPIDSTNGRRTVDEHSSLIGKDRKGKDRKGKEGINALSSKLDREADILQVFEHYKTYHPKSHPKPTSRTREWTRIRQRLDDGYTVEQLKLAIDGNHRMPFYCGANDRQRTYHNLELIVRDGSKVSEFIEGAEQQSGMVLSERTQQNLSAAESYLAKRGMGDEPIQCIESDSQQLDRPGIGVRQAN